MAEKNNNPDVIVLDVAQFKSLMGHVYLAYESRGLKADFDDVVKHIQEVNPHYDGKHALSGN